MKKIVLLICLLSIICLASTAYAAVAIQEKHEVTIANQSTDWIKNLTLPLFDTSKGTLIGVSFEVSGNLIGLVGVENLDPQSAGSIDVHLGAVLSMAKGSSVLASTAPSYDFTYNLPAFDSEFNWDGASGQTDTVPVFGTSGVVAATGPLDDYKGIGTFAITVSALGDSRTVGSGNMASYYQTSADAKAVVIYNYEPVPEPGSLAGLGVGLASLGGFALRRKK